jgi:hypothetical protein
MHSRFSIASMFFSVIALCGPASAAGDAIVTYVLQNQSGSVERDVPVTFGAVFANGDVPAGTTLAAVDQSGNLIPLQVDAKARNKDGSLRHAVLTLDVPRLAADRDFPIAIVRGTPAQGAPVAPTALPADFDAAVDLNAGGSHLTASARSLLARGKTETWLSGPLVTEWWVSGPLRDAAGKPDPHLNVRFGIRSFGKDRPLRIEVDVENDWTWVPDPQTAAYDTEIRVGGKTVFTLPGVVQQAQTRWRKVFWWSAPADVYVRQDLAYLKRTRIIPNFDPNAPSRDFAGLYRQYAAASHNPMRPGIINPHMPSTGGRPDIGPLPGWTVAYLLTMDKRFSDAMLLAGDQSGGFPSHYRNEKTGRPSTTEEFPKISTHSNYVGRPGHLQPPKTFNYDRGLMAEAAHEPSLAFIPYAVTGERYYLEELQFWSQWNAWGTAPENHGFAKGLIGWDQIRGQGWSLRTLAQAAFITPDADPMKATLLRELRANAAWYDAQYTNNPNANVFHAATRVQDKMAIAPWMDDFLTWAAQYTVQLGFDEFRPFARWKAAYPVQRMINPDYCYVMATPYYMNTKSSEGVFLKSWADAYVANFPKAYREANDPRKLQCGGAEMATVLKLRRAGEMMGNSTDPGGYPAQMQPALAAAVDAGVPGAEEAWKKFRGRPVQPAGGVGPQWAIVPWKEHP